MTILGIYLEMKVIDNEGQVCILDTSDISSIKTDGFKYTSTEVSKELNAQNLNIRFCFNSS